MVVFQRITVFSLVLSCCVFLAGCPPTPDGLLRTMLEANGVVPLTKPPTNVAKVALGKALFFDKILSGNENISCATCHHPALATSDGLSLGAGEGGAGLGPLRVYPLDDENNPVIIPRNAPDLFCRADFRSMFWDGRVEEIDGQFFSPAGASLLPGLDNVLAVQACFPVTSRDEMRGHGDSNELAEIADTDVQAIWAGLMDRLLANPTYVNLFQAAYPVKDAADFTFAHAANAIAEFEIKSWTLLDSPFDRFLAGDDTAMTAQQKTGMALFYGTARCATCHSGPLLSDELYHNTGVIQLGPGKGDGVDGKADYGREQVTGDPQDRYRFRTPPLRNVTATGPWTHAGGFTNLRATVARYNNIRAAINNYDESPLPQVLEDTVNRAETPNILASLDARMPPNPLSPQEIDSIVAFLGALTSPTLPQLPQRDIPASVPSGLPVAD